MCRPNAPNEQETEILSFHKKKIIKKKKNGNAQNEYTKQWKAETSGQMLKFIIWSSKESSHLVDHISILFSLKKVMYNCAFYWWIYLF